MAGGEAMRQSQLVLSDLFRRSFARYADREAVASSMGRLTYRELGQRAAALADYLQRSGIGVGDPVVLLLRNSLEFMIADVAIMMVGACKVPLNDMLAADEVGYMIGHSEAKAVIAHTSFARTTEAISDTLRKLTVRLAVADDTGFLDGFLLIDIVGMPTLDKNLEWPGASAIASGDRALIIYTGGTTGRSKAVLHTQQALVLNYLSHQINIGIQEDDRLLVCSPLPHSAQLFAAAALLRGGRVWIEPAFDAARVLQAIEDERLTLAFMVPTMIYRLLDHPHNSSVDTSSLRTIVYGASPITPTRLKAALARFGPVLLQIYGQTEVPNLITTLSKSDHQIDTFQTSCGQPVQFVDIAIRDAEGEELPAGEVGEVTVRSIYSLEYYHADPERTDETYIGEYLRTGDVGYLSNSGHLFLVDRAKDMIISGGFNVYSTEVENVIQQYDPVQQVVVIGVPDDDWGEAVTAFVIPRDNSFNVDEVLAHCRDKLARYKVPKRVELVAEIPLTAYGKPDKKALRAQFWSNSGRQIN